ncbi:MAG: cyclic nucleotide-binding domain-containing protein [Mariprofundaceae bacterium]|nr:cyclic nucleotide-binding domain-containing protein [Mariprofundaceae bacterium]
MNVHVIMRQARKAANKEQYKEACDLYQQVLDSDAMKDNLDIQLRLAWCHENLGHVNEACGLYQGVIKKYTDEGELGAAEALQKSVDALLEPVAVAQEDIEVKKEVVVLDKEQLMEALQEMGKDIELLAGDMLCDAGDMPDTLWLLKLGTLVIHMPDYTEDEPDKLCAKVGEFVLVGELGVFTDQRRYAAVYAEGLCRLCAIPAKRIRDCDDVAFQSAMERLLRKHWVDPVLAQHAIFERVNEVDRLNLSRSLDVVELEPGQCLIEADEEHDGAYLLQMGCLFFLHDADSPPDDELDDENGNLLTSVVPGDMIHIGGLLHGYKSPYRVIAATPVRLLHLSREAFELFSLRRPWIVQAVLRYCRRPVHLQVMRPNDDYLWKSDRHIELRKIV